MDETVTEVRLQGTGACLAGVSLLTTPPTGLIDLDRSLFLLRVDYQPPRRGDNAVGHMLGHRKSFKLLCYL